MAETPGIATEAFRYLVIFCGVILGIAIVQNIAVYLNARGNSRIPFYSNLLELPVNAGLSLVLIHGLAGLPQMGLAGAAVGSLAAVCIRAVFLIGYLWRVDGTDIAIPVWFRSTLVANMRRHFSLAWPIAGSCRSSNTICGNLLRAGGDAGYAMNIHISAQWLVTVPLTAILIQYYSVPVLWIFSIVLLEELVKAIPFHRRVRRSRWKRQLA